MLSVREKQRLQVLRTRDAVLRHILKHNDPGSMRITEAVLQGVIDDWYAELHELEQEDRQ